MNTNVFESLGYIWNYFVRLEYFLIIISEELCGKNVAAPHHMCEQRRKIYDFF